MRWFKLNNSISPYFPLGRKFPVAFVHFLHLIEFIEELKTFQTTLGGVALSVQHDIV